MITVHADVIGSLLRPPELLQARAELAADSAGTPQNASLQGGAVFSTGAPE